MPSSDSDPAGALTLRIEALEKKLEEQRRRNLFSSYCLGLIFGSMIGRGHSVIAITAYGIILIAGWFFCFTAPHPWVKKF